jgi:hypothetical protein
MGVNEEIRGAGPTSGTFGVVGSPSSSTASVPGRYPTTPFPIDASAVVRRFSAAARTSSPERIVRTASRISAAVSFASTSFTRASASPSNVGILSG